jgi:hypothetical protein
MVSGCLRIGLRTFVLIEKSGLTRKLNEINFSKRRFVIEALRIEWNIVG